MICIGLTGKAGAGKSTVADYLVEKHGFTRLSFAGPLKKMLRTLDPIVGTVNGPGVPVHLNAMFDHFDGNELEVKGSFYGAEYRRLLQVLGTDCIRAVDEEFWVRAAMKQLTDGNGRYVFDDVRFPNEAEAIKRMPAYFNIADVWNIDRPGHDAGAGTHASEQYAGRMGERYFLYNTGDPEYLYSQVDVAVEHCFEGVPA